MPACGANRETIAALSRKIRESRLVEDGVCGLFIAEKLGISQATLSEHIRVLVQAGLVRPKKIRQWTFYERDEARIQSFKDELAAGL